MIKFEFIFVTFWQLPDGDVADLGETLVPLAQLPAAVWKNDPMFTPKGAVEIESTGSLVQKKNHFAYQGSL